MKALQTYLKTRIKAILSLLEKPKKKYSPTTFHQLRVEIKKLNALFDLINCSSKKFRRKKMIKPFRTLFRQAGKVRDLQIEEATFKTHTQKDQIVAYKAKLCNQQLKQIKIFFSFINDKNTKLLKNKFKKTTPFLSKLSSKKVDQYMLKKREKIKDLLNNPYLETEQLHELRKLLKIYYYNEKSLSLKKQNQKISQKEPLMELLGKWNDVIVIIEHLQETIEKAKIDTEEIAVLETLKTKIATENEVLLEQIKLYIPQSELIK